MHVLDFLRESKDWTVHVPLYHRGHLSLRPGTTVHLAWVISTEESRDAVSASHLPELFGTTVRDRAWSSVYRISIALYDAPGVLHKALRSISRHGGNVLQLDSTSTERETHHDVEMIVDFASLLRPDQPIRDVASEIEGLLLADCAQNIVADSDGQFRVSASAVSSLRRMSRMLQLTRGSRFDPVSTIRLGEEGLIALDEGMQSMLSDAGITTPFKYLVSSDTADRVFRITFFPATQPVVWCTIRHSDVRGALESITDALQRNGITILCSLNRVQEHLGKNWFEAVLASASWRAPASIGQSAPVEIVRQILESSELDPYDLKPFFNQKEAKEYMLEANAEAEHAQLFVLRREDVDQWLNAKQQELDRVNNDLHGIDSRDRYTSAPLVQYANALRSGIARVRRETARVKRHIFISIEFTPQNEKKIFMVEKACRQFGLTFEVVRGPKDQRVIWQEVITRMRDTTDFVAIWTPSIKATSQIKRPSPWCLWELGIANAFGLSTYVLADRRADLTDYKLIHGTEFYYEFRTAAEFEQKVTEVVEAIARGGPMPTEASRPRFYSM